MEDVAEARAHTRLPVVLGSGVTVDNLDRFFGRADGFIIGTHFKVNGHWANTVDPQRVDAFMGAVRNPRDRL